MSRSRGTPWLASPALLYLVVFSVLPTALIVGYSFCERDFYADVKAAFSLEAWRQATDLITLKTLGRSLLLAASVTAIDLLLAYPCVLALARMDRSLRGMFVVLISFPLVTSLLLRIYGWMNLLPLEWRGTLPSVALVMAVNYLPFMVLPLLRAFERLESGVVAAALDLGATPWQAFWRVTWPLTRSGMWAGCALVFIPATGEYLVPRFIGEGHVNVLGTVIVQEFMERRNWPYAAACAVWLMAIVLAPLLGSLVAASRSASIGAARDREPT
ncbi:MAG: ABC transporter permease [Pirellulaceae bacterium]